ncbi:MAG: DNA-binding response regulator [Phenylobacterium sp.]|uniref:LytTR family DNA-binding domain-containing protein n=1 Tax=Phenylobacterium sp. TaxID=1871053 RepID=UPI0025D10D05|nr:LytTR family DNA-binding domain-containing protein [Phenylobacterium sp.]MBI1197597.1 DNA-binding response regulator [Phenylobacterium sp.]
MTTPSTSDQKAAAARSRGALLAAWIAIGLFFALENTVNALSRLAENPDLQPVRPFILEYSSGLAHLALVPFVAWTLRIAPPGRGRWLRFVLVHAPATIAFSVLHIVGFLALRKAAFAIAGWSYGWWQPLYEYRKDVLAYVVYAAVIWTSDWAARLHASASAAKGEPRLYVVRDGARTLRAPVEDIVAVNSARNYVEFHLADGARTLARDTLAKVEADLADAGFLRTHRSWLVNPAHVRVVAPTSSGDMRLELSGGVTAPLSRRFPAALEALRGGDAVAA